LPWIFGASVVLLAGLLSQLLLGRGVLTRVARGILGAAPLVAGGLILLLLGVVDGAGPRVALLVLGSGISGAIYVVCPAMIGEFVLASQRGAVISIYGAIYWRASSRP